MGVSSLIIDKYSVYSMETAMEMSKNISKFADSDYELKDYVVYTCDTLEYFKNKYPNDEIYFVCGADNLSYVDEWKNGFILLENYKFLVIRRNTDNIDKILKRYKKYCDNIILSDISMNSLSSTEIREKIKNKESIDGVVDSNVSHYISEKGLYLNQEEFYEKISIRID